MYSSSTTLTVLLSANSWTVASPPPRADAIFDSQEPTLCVKILATEHHSQEPPPHYLLSKSQSSSSYKLHHSIQRTIFVHFVFVSTSHFVFVSTFHFVFVFTFHFVFVSTSSILYLIQHISYFVSVTTFHICICEHISNLCLYLRTYLVSNL